MVVIDATLMKCQGSFSSYLMALTYVGGRVPCIWISIGLLGFLAIWQSGFDRRAHNFDAVGSCLVGR